MVSSHHHRISLLSGRVLVKPKIAVVGSTNMDLIVPCVHIPRPGETVIAKGGQESPGGKGANQAVGAARAGGDVQFLTRVGDDGFGKLLLANLQQEGVSPDSILITPGVSSGLAIVMVEDSGENAIAVVPGANGCVTAEDVESHAEVIRSADILLLQLELTLEPVLAAIRIARDARVRIVVDPAPVPASFPEELLQVDVVCPNQGEASAILGAEVRTIQDARQAAWQLVRRGAKQAIITLGADGAVICDGNNVDFIAPFEVQAIDTTAAGDAFAAAFAVSWGEGKSIQEATRFGCAAGALAASRSGAQNAMPTRAEIDARLLEFVS